MTIYYLYQQYKYTSNGIVPCFEEPKVFAQQPFINYLQRELRLDVTDYAKGFDESGVMSLRNGNHLHYFKRIHFGIIEEKDTVETFIDTLNK